MADGDGYFDLRNPGAGIPYNQNDNGFDMGMENSQRNYPTTDPSTDRGNGGGNWFTNGLGNLFGNITGGIGSALSNPALIPSLGAAWNQWRDSSRYTDMAEKYADRLDPFGQQRAGYQTKLQNAYDDPASVLKDPAHTGIQNIEMDNIMRKLGASGGSTSNMGVSLADYVGKSDAQYLQQERQQLAELSGAQFGPGAAAHMLETGMRGSIDSRNKALDALMYPFGKGSDGNGGGNGNGNGRGNGNGGGNGNPRDYYNQASRMLQNPNSLPEAMRNWSPTQLASWLQYNKPLGNDSWGNFLTRGGGGDGTVDGGGDDFSWQIPDHGDGSYGPPMVDDNWDLQGPGGGGGMGDADWQMGMPDDGSFTNWDIGDNTDFSDLGDFDWGW